MAPGFFEKIVESNLFPTLWPFGLFREKLCVTTLAPGPIEPSARTAKDTVNVVFSPGGCTVKICKETNTRLID